jgi:hypothetical protein
LPGQKNIGYEKEKAKMAWKAKVGSVFTKKKSRVALVKSQHIHT